MMRTLLTLASVTLGCLVFGQARIVINDDAWVRIDNGAWVVIDHGNVNGIRDLGYRGQHPFRRRIEPGALAHRNHPRHLHGSVHHGCRSEDPGHPAKTTAGAGATASIAFSTYNFTGFSPSWNNFNYRPSDVTHMNNWFTGGPNNPAAQNESQVRGGPLLGDGPFLHRLLRTPPSRT